MVLPSAGELLFLFSDPPVGLLAHLAQLESGAQHLVLLLLEGALSLLQGGLQLLLLLLEVAPLLVQVVDGAAALAELVQQILDLVSQVLVLPFDNVKLLNTP